MVIDGQKELKNIGLIGGMSWESSKIYYELINKRVKSILGGAHSARSLMVSVDFDIIAKLTFEDKWQEIGEIMSVSAQQLERGGADFILLCTNTIHLVSEAIAAATNIPFLHIADATGEAIQKQQLRKVALLGTKFTMEKDFYRNILEENYGLEILVPPSNEREIINDIIYNELVNGQFTEASKEICLSTMSKLKKNGAEGVILGCTELPLLIANEDFDLPLFDTTKIHAYQAVDYAIKDLALSY